MLPAELSDIIKDEALRAGFDLCGITDAGVMKERAERLNIWIENGCHGSMDYMVRNADKRSNPSLLVADAKAVIVVALNYFSPNNREENSDPIISRYASGLDYHIVMKEKLKSLLKHLKLKVSGLEGRVFTDSAPLMEKALAVKAGLGRQGKNTLLLSNSGGSFFFLGEIIINLEAASDNPDLGDPCGSCTECIDACPTGAITPEGYLDARNCISYLTIEHQGDIPEKFKGKLGNRVFGCDICQDVCPHNYHSNPHRTAEFNLNTLRAEMTPKKWEELTPDQFSEVFKGSSVARCSYEKFMKNIRFNTKPPITEK